MSDPAMSPTSNHHAAAHAAATKKKSNRDSSGDTLELPMSAGKPKTANCSLDHRGPLGVPYRPDLGLEKSSLSMRLMHRPSRAQKELEKASDPTRKNSLLNSLCGPDRDSDSEQVSPQEVRSHLSVSEDALSLDSTPLCLPRHNLVRKKSGEIVKPLLKDKTLPVNMRSRSLPSTPTYKQVHFGGDTDVRYFKKKDKPNAILAQNSPKLYDEDDDDDDENHEIPSLEFEGDLRMQSLFNPNRKSYFEYYDDELNSHVDDTATQSKRQPQLPSPKDWLLDPLNFSPRENALTYIRKGKQVFLENIFLSADKRYLLGQVAVQNIDFEKSVTIRYSVDKWCTIVEIQAIYIPDIPHILKAHNYDRFMFKISLDLFVNGFHTSVDPLSTAPPDFLAELCVKYRVNGQELWDNNEDQNYLFTLKKGTDFQLDQEKLPSSARTKKEVHKKKPKYSSSYLKRIKSDSSLSKHSGYLSAENSPQSLEPSSKVLSPHQGAETVHLTNDYESNGYYLSSPLFSSFTNKNIDADLREATLRQNFKQPRLSRPSLSGSKSHQGETNCAGRNYDVSREFSPEADAFSLPRVSRNLQEPMSYRDFLDSYCFFNSQKHDNNSKTTLVMSDGPSSKEDAGTANNELGVNSDHVYSVSSFLT